MILFLSSNVMDKGFIFLPILCRDCSKMGCLASFQSRVGKSFILGKIAFTSVAQIDLDLMKSISPSHWNQELNIGTNGLMRSDKRLRINIISLRSADSNDLISLFAINASAGSKNTVLPVSDSSCTKPFIFLLCSAASGMTIRPFRKVSEKSLLTQPSL